MSKDARDEELMLTEARAQGRGATLKTWFKLSGPGYLQSAITLGGGSLAGSLFLGVIGGYSMLWVQLVAITLGVIMLAAIGYVTLTIETSPFDGMRRKINPALAWGWLLATLFANMIWALPQYSLAFAAITENLMPNAFLDTEGLGTKFTVTLIVFAVVTAATLLYGEGRGARIYENILKVLIAVIVIAFFGVVARLGVEGALPWGEIFAGFIPNLSHLTQPAGGFREVLDTIADPAARQYWSDQIVGIQRDTMIAAASAAVGINMTFLMPFSLLARKWNRNFRGLAMFDLSTGMIIPFILATGCVVITAASQFHTEPYEGAAIAEDGSITLVEGFSPGAIDELKGALDKRREALPDTAASPEESQVAAMLVARSNRELAFSLEGLFGNSVVSQKIFGIGVLAMAMSTISLLMLISGFALCEALGAPHGGKTHKIGTLFASTGILWPLLWEGNSKAFLAVTVGTIGYTLLPIALFSFLFMLNSRRLLGADTPTGGKRLAWNLLMGTALLITGSAAIWTAWNKDLFGFPIGKVLLAVTAVAVVLGHLHIHRKHRDA